MSRTTRVRRVFGLIHDLKFKTGTAQEESQLLKISFSDIVGGQQALSDWFDEFLVDRVDIHLYNISTSQNLETRVFVCQENNNSRPVNVLEFTRMAGARVYAYSPMQGVAVDGKLPLLLSVRRPVFDLTGSGNDFASKWLPTTLNDATQFNLASVLVDSMGNGITVDLQLYLEVHLQFRGLQ